jgi:hypothetical protein
MRKNGTDAPLRDALLLLLAVIPAIFFIGDSMIDQAVLQKEIETLPPKYIGEVVDFVGYLQKQAQQEAVEVAMAGKRDKEIINRYADELNKEMEDVLSYQTLDI